MKGLASADDKTKIAEDAFAYFLKKRHEIELFSGVEDALKALSEKYMLGVLTNGNADIYKLSIGKYFEFSISSLEAQDSKPNKPHFELAKSHLPNLKYGEMLHIGDHQINDIFGAHALGIKVLWFNNTKALWEQDFEKDRGNKWLILISFVIGLSFGVHFMGLLVIPAIGMIYFFKKYPNPNIKNFIIANILSVAILLFIFKLLLPSSSSTLTTNVLTV